ncbi:hypothetical protein ACOMHN_005602 [Nucella lapillus]
MDHPEEDWEGKIEIDVVEDPDPPVWTQGQGSVIIKTEPIAANICSDVIKTEPVTACTYSDVIKTEPITANISSDIIKTELITADISSDVIKTEPITADISSDVIKTKPITADISSDVIKTEPITANICSDRDVIKTEPITANISSDVIKTEPITADIGSDVIKTEPITADISTHKSITSGQRGVDTQTGDKQQSIEVGQVIQDRSHLIPAVYRGRSEGHPGQVTSCSSSLSRSVRSSKTCHISFQQSIEACQKVIQERSHIPAVYRGRSEGHPRQVTSHSSSLSRSVRRSSKTGHISFQQSIEVGQKVIQDRSHLIPAVYRGLSGHPRQVTSHSSSLSGSVRRSSRSLLCGVAVPSPDGRKSSIWSRTSAVSEEDDLPNDEHADNTGDGESGGIPVWLTGEEDDKGDDEGDDDEGDVDEGDDDDGDDDEGVEGEDELQSGLSYACLFGLCGTRSLPYPVFCRHGQGGTEHPAPRVSEGTVRFGAPTWLSLPVTRRNLARIHLSVGRVAEPAVGRKALVDRPDIIKTEPITADISSDVIKTEPITSDISSDVIKTEPITADISSDVIKTEPITANICSYRDVIKTESITANISSDVVKTEPITADISSDVIKTEPITADISTPESITSGQRGVDTQTGDKQEYKRLSSVTHQASGSAAPDLFHTLFSAAMGKAEANTRRLECRKAQYGLVHPPG